MTILLRILPRQFARALTLRRQGLGAVVAGQVASDFKWTPADPGFADLPTLTHFMGLTQNDPQSLANALIDAMFHTALAFP